MFNDNSNTCDDDDCYFCSPSFFTRFILLLMLLAAWVAAAVALDSSSLAASGLSSTRTAFLIIAVLAFVESLTIMILSLVDIINEILYLILDVVFGLMLLAVSIAAIVRDNQVNNGTISNSQYRFGSLAAAAVFGFVSVVLYALQVIFYIVGID